MRKTSNNFKKTTKNNNNKNLFQQKAKMLINKQHTELRVRIYVLAGFSGLVLPVVIKSGLECFT